MQEWAENILVQVRSKMCKELTSGIFTATIYHIWRATNELKHQGKPNG